MKIYQNFKKYFNTNPRLWIVAVCVVAESMTFLILCAKWNEEESDTKMILILMMIYAAFASAMMYMKQIALVKVRIGKDLKRRGYDVVSTLDEIDRELNNPVFSQIHSGINRSANFIITKNWIVGSDDLIAMRANALAVKDVVAVETDLVVSYSVAQQSNNITKKQFSMLKITDVHNRCYSFFVLNPQYQSEAYNYVLNNIVNVNKSSY